jgi:hypothetical protein
MLGRGRQSDRGSADEGEARQPLLDNVHDQDHENVIFDLGADEDSDGTKTPSPIRKNEDPPKRNGHVRFQEEVQVRVSWGRLLSVY